MQSYKSKITNLFMPSNFTMRISYIMEILLNMKTPILICGPKYSGKTTFARKMCFEKIYEYKSKVISNNIQFTPT